jgi:hypothetical protein
MVSTRRSILPFLSPLPLAGEEGVRPKVALWPVDMISGVFPLTSLLSPWGEEARIYFLSNFLKR